jgi:hypothetical protein
MLDLLLKGVFRGESIPTAEELERLKKDERKDTLGRLLWRLRQKVELDSELNVYLSTFLDDRNRFVHHLVEGGGGVSASQEEIYRYCRNFSEKLQKSSFRLIELFFATQLKWFISLKPDEQMDEETKLFVEQAGQWKKSSEQLFQVRKNVSRPRRRERRSKS